MWTQYFTYLNFVFVSSLVFIPLFAKWAISSFLKSWRCYQNIKAGDPRDYGFKDAGDYYRAEGILYALCLVFSVFLSIVTFLIK